jgi:hypothetical protein
MIVNSYNSEFGYELIATLPYAYWLHLRGELDKTISAKDTRCLYYFSRNHFENPERRSWYHGDTTAVAKMIEAEIPNAWIHVPKLNTDKFMPPPYKKSYKNNWAKFYKHTFVIYNRYNLEYPATYNQAFNYFSEDFLEEVFTRLKDDFEIVYCNIEGQPDLYDHCDPLPMEDYELCKKHGITHIRDLQEKHPGLTYNQILLYYFANCHDFLTMNGGGGILASYFGGRNIIYSRFSKELNSGDFGYYHLFGGSKIIPVTTYDEILHNL